jgi:hypothetical protein
MSLIWNEFRQLCKSGQPADLLVICLAGSIHHIQDNGDSNSVQLALYTRGLLRTYFGADLAAGAGAAAAAAAALGVDTGAGVYAAAPLSPQPLPLPSHQ